MKYNSLTHETKDGVPVVVVVGRTTQADNVTFHKWFVSVKDCKRQMGQLVMRGLDDGYQGKFDFVFGGGSAACHVAEAICSGYFVDTGAQR